MWRSDDPFLFPYYFALFYSPYPLLAIEIGVVRSSFSNCQRMRFVVSDRVPVDRPLFVNTSMTAQQRVDLYRRLCEPIQDSEPALQMRFWALDLRISSSAKFITFHSDIRRVLKSIQTTLPVRQNYDWLEESASIFVSFLFYTINYFASKFYF